MFNAKRSAKRRLRALLLNRTNPGGVHVSRLSKQFYIAADLHHYSSGVRAVPVLSALQASRNEIKRAQRWLKVLLLWRMGGSYIWKSNPTYGRPVLHFYLQPCSLLSFPFPVLPFSKNLNWSSRIIGLSREYMRWKRRHVLAYSIFCMVLIVLWTPGPLCTEKFFSTGELNFEQGLTQIIECLRVL